MFYTFGIFCRDKSFEKILAKCEQAAHGRRWVPKEGVEDNLGGAALHSGLGVCNTVDLRDEREF